MSQLYNIYVCTIREVYRQYVQGFAQRLWFELTGDKDNFDMMNHPRLGESTIDSKLLDATRRQFDRAARRYR